MVNLYDNTQKNNSDIDYRIRITLLGYSGVGKSSIIEKFLYGEFNYNVQTTIGSAFLFKNIQMDDKKIQLIINDTAGQEKYNSIPKIYYRDINAFILVLDVTDKNSIENLDFWLKDIKYNGNKSNIIFFVGNKIDFNETLRIMSNSEINETLENMYNSCFENSEMMPYLEVSALSGENIDILFNMIVNKCLQSNKYELVVKDNKVTNSEKKRCC